MLLYVLLAVFVSGLMVGRTPEYLGKKIEAREVKIVLVGLLVPPVMVLVLTALAVTLPSGLASIFNPGPHGFSEALYAYTSQGNNNGSAFAGYGATTFSTLLGGSAMLFGRFVPLVAALAVAGSLAAKKTAPVSAGTFRTDSPTFVGVLITVVVVLSALTVLPALALGPIVESLLTRTF
jgi:K+-transporting ATPase ATPase A chain